MISVVLSTFSHSYWTLICLLWKNIYSGFLKPPQIKPCWPSQPNILKACLPGAEFPGLRSLMWASDLHSLRRISTIIVILHLWVTHLGGVGFDDTMTLPLLPFLWLLFYIFSIRRIYSGRFWYFSSIVIL